MTFDDKNNIVEVCLFESFLAKYFIEHPEIFEPLLDKIAIAIDSLIQANSKNSDFDRRLFATFTETLSQDSSLKNFDAVKKSRSLIIWDTFLKYFIERVMTIPNLIYPSLKRESSLESLKGLIHYSLFNTTPNLYQKKLLEKMRPNDLFSDENRGCIELEEEPVVPSFNIGILSETSETSIPEELVNYLKFENYPSKQFYAPKEDSEMANWLREHYLPVISGASGGIGKTISYLTTLLNFSSIEYKLLGLLVASSTIALGHHSFFEVMRPLSFIMNFIEEKEDLCAFYEQVIPAEIKALSSYKEHMSGPYGAALIKNLSFAEKEAGELEFRNSW